MRLSVSRLMKEQMSKVVDHPKQTNESRSITFLEIGLIRKEKTEIRNLSNELPQILILRRG